MNKTSFPVNDLLRRKTQTSLVVICLTLSVASTLFLLLFSSRIGVGIVSVSQNILTVGLLVVFAQFIWFVGALIFAVGAVLTSFMVFLMMNQRMKDLGLIKAAGCPNDSLFGYYMSELLIVTTLSCVLGAIIGLASDYAVSGFSGLALNHSLPNLLLVPVVFVTFFILSLVIGVRPLLDAATMPPLSALSPIQYYGLTNTARAKPFTKSSLTAKVSLRSLLRRKTATVRILLLLSIVFVLLTVSVAGSLIAKETTTSWVQRSSGEHVIAIAHEEVAEQYKLLESTFVGMTPNTVFDYTNPQLAISDDLIQQISQVIGVVRVDERLIFEDYVHEISNFTIDPDTMATIPVGDNREGNVLIVGVEPSNVTSKWFTQGRFLNSDDKSSVVVGDAVAEQMFSKPFAQSISIRNHQLSIVGVCVDPINNGRVVYVHLETLKNMTGLSANIVLIESDPSVDHTVIMDRIGQIAKGSGSDLLVFNLDETASRNISFLGSVWSNIMMLPVLVVFAAALCLTAYVMLAVDEQRQEFGFLRSMGAKPSTVTKIVALQSVIVLLSSAGFGLSIGVIATLLVLMRQPLVTSFTIVQIAAWLFAASAVIFILSLVPAIKLARTPILKIIA